MSILVLSLGNRLDCIEEVIEKKAFIEESNSEVGRSRKFEINLRLSKVEHCSAHF